MDKSTSTLKSIIENLSGVFSDYRELLDHQNEILESIYAELAKYKDSDVLVDTEKASKEEIVSPSTQVVGSESPKTSRCFISAVTSPASQPQNERIQMQETGLFIQKVVYSDKRKKRSQLTLSSTLSPYLPRRDIEISEPEETSPLTSHKQGRYKSTNH